MRNPSGDTIPGLLVENVSRELVLAVEDGLVVGARRAFVSSKDMAKGHRPSVVGQLRHFHMNEAFHQSLEGAGIVCSPIKGNALVTGSSGMFKLARFNIKEGLWVNARRSQTRKHMALANRAIEPLVQPGFFDEYRRPDSAVAFFVGIFSGAPSESPSSIDIAVPNRDMSGWLFREPLQAFLERYEAVAKQEDLAKPKLKSHVRSRRKDGTAG
jgi:hypothetical protein